jgi:transmembrane sensor
MTTPDDLDPRQHDALRSALSSRAHGTETDAAWAVLRGRMAEADRTAVERQVVPIRRPWRVALRYAATILIAVGGTLVWRSMGQSGSLDAPAGSSRSVMLPDGSRLTLAPGSRATWDRGFGRTAREIRLEGEGFFDVVHDTTRPFRVIARGGVAQDVGTRFVVRARPELPMLDVAVQEGAVALSPTAPAAGVAPTVLVAGQRGQLRADGQVAVSAAPADSFDWLDGALAFEATPLNEALPELGRWYAVELRASPALAGRRLSARFVPQPLPQLLDALALALDARVVHDGASYTLIPR